MATTVDIANIALSHLGAKPVVSSIDPPDGSAEAAWCSRFFLQAVYRLLEREDWAFARARAALSPLDLPLGTTWAYAYSLPSDCLKPRRIVTGDSLQFEDDGAPYSIEGNTLLTNERDAILIYTQPLKEPTQFPPSFSEALSYELAAYLAGPILKGTEGIQAAGNLRRVAASAAANAAAMDGDSQDRPKDQYIPDSLRARGKTGGIERRSQGYPYAGGGFTII